MIFKKLKYKNLFDLFKIKEIKPQGKSRGPIIENNHHAKDMIKRLKYLNQYPAKNQLTKKLKIIF